MLERAHNKFGYLGINATLRLVGTKFFCVSMKADVERYTKDCQVCCETRPQFFSKREDGVLIESTKPMERLSINFVGPKNTPSGNSKWILTAIDEYSRYLEGD